MGEPEMRHLFQCALALTLLLLWVDMHLLQGQEKPEVLAQKSAESWLATVDSGKYGESWDQAAENFRSSGTKEQWEKAVGSVREQTATLKSRKLLRADYTQKLPNVPEGEYVVLQYESSFANAAAAIETVTPTRERDGSWRVSGYFVKPKK